VNGDNLQKITNLPTSTEARPAYFPNGDKIVFRSDKDGDRERYSMDLDGTDLRRLTYSSGSDSSAKVSPKGNQIVVESNRDGHEEIYIMDINGNNQTRLTNSGGQPNIGPNWSPDGSMIVFSSRRDDGDAEIYIMNSDGSNQQRITTLPNGDIEPVFSPDGKHIVFRHHMGSDTHNL